MRISVLCLLVSLMAGGWAHADEADPFLSVEAAMPFRERWQDCTAAAVKRQLDGQRPAEAVLDIAFRGCKARENALIKVLSRRLGPSGAQRVVAELRDRDRMALARIMERLRAR